MRRRAFVLGSFALTGSLAAGCAADTAQAPSPSTAGAAQSPPAGAAAIPIGRISDAVAQLTAMGSQLMNSSGIPGMAVAVVSGGKTVYSSGFGVRDIATSQAVNADTVFQLASLSKSVGATVIAHQVGLGSLTWDTPIVSKLPAFALADPYVFQHVTIADMYAHRSGLPEHAGDRLEDLGYDRAAILARLGDIALDPFRAAYGNTNFGIVAAAEAVAATAGQDWETLSQNTIYGPLGMTSTSSRFSEFSARGNKAVGHVLVDGKYAATSVRDPQAQSAAGGVSSSVNDMATWLTMVLASGQYNGKKIVESSALLPAVTAQMVSAPSTSAVARAGMDGYGFTVSNSAAGRTTISHSGAFTLGAATNFLIIPSADVAIVVLTNAAPLGIPETLTAQFADLVQFGEIAQDWRAIYTAAFASLAAKEGSLVGHAPPSNPAPAQAWSSYVGEYKNDHWGSATISAVADGLVLTIGPNKSTYPLTHWDGDTFTFELRSENAMSAATFSARDTLVLEYFNSDALGRFVK